MPPSILEALISAEAFLTSLDQLIPTLESEEVLKLIREARETAEALTA